MKHLNKNWYTQKHHAVDRYNGHEYLIDQNTYEYILDTINQYHESMYLFPDHEKVVVFEDLGDHLSALQLPINRLIFD